MTLAHRRITTPIVSQFFAQDGRFDINSYHNSYLIGMQNDIRHEHIQNCLTNFDTLKNAGASVSSYNPFISNLVLWRKQILLDLRRWMWLHIFRHELRGPSNAMAMPLVRKTNWRGQLCVGGETRPHGHGGQPGEGSSSIIAAEVPAEHETRLSACDSPWGVYNTD